MIPIWIIIALIVIIISLITWYVYGTIEKYTNEQMTEKVGDTAVSIFAKAPKPIPKNKNPQILIIQILVLI